MISRGRLFLYRLIFAVVLLALWELSSGRWIDPFWVSSPSQVFLYLYGVFADGSIYGHLAITLYETFAGFFIGSIFGIGLGFALGQREVLAQTRSRLNEQARHRLRERRQELQTLTSRLRLLGPEQVLARGYSITVDDATGEVLRDTNAVKGGQRLRTRLAKGEVRSRAEK